MESSIQRPHACGRRTRFLVASVAATLGSLLFAAPAFAESCLYDPATKAVTATVTPGSEATLTVVGTDLYFGLVPSACLGATTANTDSISIAGAGGSNERLILDERGGVFGPGFTAEGNVPEIEIATTLGDATDTVVVYATEGDDTLAPGQLGMALNTDGDVDVTYSPSAFNMEIHVLGGVDYVNGFGQGGAGMHFLGPLVIAGGDGDDVLLRGSTLNDRITGGAGNDVIEGNDLADVIDGGPGNDTIRAGGGDDDITGGSGSDLVAASDGNDAIHVDDSEADASIHGGAGTDTAYLDAVIDPPTVAVEIKIFGPPPPPPPPPPPGTCAYDAATKAVTVQMEAGSSATLKVVDGAISFGTVPEACGAATAANTDSIAISGGAGTVESLTIDQTGGSFAPGATPESGTGAIGEIEIAAQLGDATDVIVVLGTDGNDTISAGLNGVAFNTDTDVDVTFGPAPAVLELRGLGGVNTLSGLGGFGSGQAFAGRLLLYAGDLGDTLRGSGLNDELYGGAAADVLEGRLGSDTITGGGGNDTLSGAGGDDTLTGGAGADSLSGSDGADTIYADDDLADTAINGGPGIDTAYYDLGVDPLPLATENKIPA
jgi:Ca2+-binding RTX toxin-like protein